jgi:hypothetical protein
MRLALLDALQERVLPVVVAALGFLAIGLPLARATGMGAPTRIALDFGLWWSWLVSSGLAIWLGSRCIAGPLADRTATFQLVRPISPGLWGLQRLAGAALVGLGAQTLVTGPSLWAAGAAMWPGIAFWWTTGLEVVLLVGLAAGFGTLFRPLPTLGLVSGLWFAGHLAGMWRALLVEQGRETLATTVLALIPDLDLLDIHATVLAGRTPELAHLLLATGWSLAWTVAAAAATVAVLQRRDLA